MIPQKKKTPEELAALREELGIPGASPQSESPTKPRPPVSSDPATTPATIPESAAPNAPHSPQPPGGHSKPQSRDPVVHLGIPSVDPPQETRPVAKSHSLRKHDLPLAPPTEATSKTAIPTQRRGPQEIAEWKRREALANLAQGPMDPGAHLRKITAHPVLLTPAYLCAFGAAAAAWQRTHYFTPLALIAIATLLAIYIFFAKKRSRHHSAILTIIIVMTLAFGGLHYAPLIFYAP